MDLNLLKIPNEIIELSGTWRDLRQGVVLRGGSFFNLHTLLECFVPGYETLPGFLREGMKHFEPSSSRV